MNRSSGFSLVEVVISGALVATTLGALFAVASMTTRLTVQGQNRLIASQLAREGIEVMRFVRDRSMVEPCPEGQACAWYSGLFDPSIARPPVVKGLVLDSQKGFTLRDTTLDTDNSCSDTIERDLTSGQLSLVTTPTTGEKKETYCRRIIIEPIDLPETSEDESTTWEAVRVRSQVAWLGYGRNAFRTLTVGDSNGCDPKSSEWCTEQVTLLTHWRSAL